MLTLPPSVKVYLALGQVDMRNGFDGLLGRVQSVLKADPYSGHLFVFVSRRADRAKVLFWDVGGFVLYYKRLEMGKFRLPTVHADAASVQMDATELAMLLDGIDYSRVRRPVPWTPKPVIGPIGCPPKKLLDTRSRS